MLRRSGSVLGHNGPMKIADTQEATYQVWVELKSNLHRFISRRANNEADADDILQDVFFKIHLNIGRVRDTTKIHSWVYRITRNAIIDYYRKRRSELSLDATPNGFDVMNEEPGDSETDREEIMACLTPMVERLPNDYKKALVMSDVQGITQAKVADELNLSVSGAKSRVQRARGKMKNMLLDCCHFEFDRLGRAVTMTSRNCGSGCGERKC
jgi:RNA polymerase sigma-70 factor, ECF subfamily